MSAPLSKELREKYNVCSISQHEGFRKEGKNKGNTMETQQHIEIR